MLIVKTDLKLLTTPPSVSMSMRKTFKVLFLRIMNQRNKKLREVPSLKVFILLCLVLDILFFFFLVSYAYTALDLKQSLPVLLHRTGSVCVSGSLGRVACVVMTVMNAEGAEGRSLAGCCQSLLCTCEIGCIKAAVNSWREARRLGNSYSPLNPQPWEFIQRNDK